MGGSRDPSTDDAGEDKTAPTVDHVDLNLSLLLSLSLSLQFPLCSFLLAFSPPLFLPFSPSLLLFLFLQILRVLESGGQNKDPDERSERAHKSKKIHELFIAEPPPKTHHSMTDVVSPRHGQRVEAFPSGVEVRKAMGGRMGTAKSLGARLFEKDKELAPGRQNSGARTPGKTSLSVLSVFVLSVLAHAECEENLYLFFVTYRSPCGCLLPCALSHRLRLRAFLALRCSSSVTSLALTHWKRGMSFFFVLCHSSCGCLLLHPLPHKLRGYRSLPWSDPSAFHRLLTHDGEGAYVSSFSAIVQYILFPCLPTVEESSDVLALL